MTQRTLKNRISTIFDRGFWAAALPLVLPIALQNLLMTSFRLIDTLMVGRLGDVSIAAVGLAGWASFLVELLAFGMASGAAVFVAQYHGAGNREGILRTYGMMLVFMVPLGLTFTIGVGLNPEWVMRLFTEDAALIGEGVKYLRFACVSYVSLTVNLALSTMLRCTERVKNSDGDERLYSRTRRSTISLSSARFGLPAMGVAGARLATAISLLNPVLMLIISAAKRRSALKQVFALKGFQSVLVALPVLLNEFSGVYPSSGINMVLGRMGTDNYAALTVERTIGDSCSSFSSVCATPATSS
ncbi:MAG: MATE family efflux transporter [Eubacteriales bacterium]